MNLIPECIELLNHASGEENEALAHFYALLCVAGGIAIALLSEMCFSHHHNDDAAGLAGPGAKPEDTASTGDSGPSTGGDIGMYLLQTCNAYIRFICFYKFKLQIQSAD